MSCQALCVKFVALTLPLDDASAFVLFRASSKGNTRSKLVAPYAVKLPDMVQDHSCSWPCSVLLYTLQQQSSHAEQASRADGHPDRQKQLSAETCAESYSVQAPIASSALKSRFSSGLRRSAIATSSTKTLCEQQHDGHVQGMLRGSVGQPCVNVTQLEASLGLQVL